MTDPSTGPQPTPEPTSQPTDPVWSPPIPPSDAEGVVTNSAVGAPAAGPEPMTTLTTAGGTTTSPPPGRRRWLEVALLVGAFVVVGGIGFAAGRTIDDQGRGRGSTHMIVGDQGQGGQRQNRQQLPGRGMYPSGGFGPGDGSGGFRGRHGSGSPDGRMPGGQFPAGPGGRMLPGFGPQPGATAAPNATQVPLATPTPSASPAQ